LVKIEAVLLTEKQKPHDCFMTTDYCHLVHAFKTMYTTMHAHTLFIPSFIHSFCRSKTLSQDSLM